MDFPTKHMLRCFAVLWLGKATIGSTSLFSRPNVETSTESNSTWNWCADPASQERWYCGFFYEGQRLLRGEYVYDRDPKYSAMRWMLKRCGSAFVWALDVIGVLILGQYWEKVKAVVIVTAILLLSTIVMYGLDLFLRPFLWMGKTVIRLRRRYLPRQHDTPQPTKCDALDWRGPGAREEVDNDFYRDQIRGRNAAHIPNHLLISIDGRTVRLDKGPQRPRPVNRHGLRYNYTQVVSANSAVLRQRLEDEPAETRYVHLCRHHPCGETEGGVLHVPIFTAVDSGELLDLQEDGWNSPILQCCTLLGTVVCGLRRLVTTGLCGCTRRRRCRRCARRAPPHVRQGRTGPTP